jgi:hypothetical protein
MRGGTAGGVKREITANIAVVVEFGIERKVQGGGQAGALQIPGAERCDPWPSMTIPRSRTVSVKD